MSVRQKVPEDLTARKALALEVIDRLKKEYPDAGCTLDYAHAWQLLVSVRLAAQCTDARVNIVVEDLFAKYPSVAALAAAEPEDIEAIVKPCGLGHSKARDISACMRMLRDKYDCQVPATFEELLALPGVGRKSANLIMGDVWQASHRDRYPLHPAVQQDRPCGRHQGAAESRNGPVEDHPARGRQRSVPSFCDAWPGCVQCAQTGMRSLLFEGHLPLCAGAIRYTDGRIINFRRY